ASTSSTTNAHVLPVLATYPPTSQPVMPLSTTAVGSARRAIRWYFLICLSIVPPFSPLPISPPISHLAGGPGCCIRCRSTRCRPSPRRWPGCPPLYLRPLRCGG